MSNLPWDMLAEILCRLPAKKLLCFRCVSKLWRALIDGPNFINLHLKHSLATSSNLHIIVKNSELCSVDFDLLDNLKQLEHPLMCYNHSIKILGSCNGLLCICNVVDDIALWNPSIRKYHVLPYLSIELNRYFGTCSCRVCVFGLGYDQNKDDFKVVRIAQFTGVDKKSIESEVKVYSLRRNSWRRIGDMPYFVLYPGANGMFVSGALHWLVSQSPESNVADVIVALDLGVEDYREVPQPEGMGKNFKMDMGILHGCLCLLGNFQGQNTDVWVMKKYGVKESWTKSFSISQHEVIGSLRPFKPLAYSRSGNAVLMEHDNINLFWYDPSKKEAENVLIQNMPITFETELYVGSLVPINANRFLQESAHEETNTNNRRDDFLSKGFKLLL
ncbi:hypothetical protein JCGZ_13698 [Jatropha curcas]|uniref:F-box domain-containing protein n=1 Tax=Jatropha curcas TaxID=180498 RepID=A0A067K9X2_JATCU|nr:F-box protein CPR1 [Jatropha curcas]KDP32917.1 hypothetical protein JCGZ_13698 [Jatropha curcas]